MRQKLKMHIPMAFFSVCFALFYFAFEDLSIRLIYLYAALGILILCYITANPKVYISKINVSFLIMALVALFFFLLPYSTREYDMVAVIITILFCAVLSFFSIPDERELNAIINTIVYVAFFVSVYVIAVAFFPSLYIDHISRFISESPKETTIRMLKMGYGVIIGGNAILVNHILVIALLIMINKFLFFGLKNEKIKAGAFILLAFCAMVFENRKGELLVFALVTFYAFYSSGLGGFVSRFRKGIRITLIGIAVLIIVVIVTIRLGFANRYLTFFERIFGSEKSDFSSGRLELWAIAIDLFKKHPILGVGWGSARNYIHMFNTANQTYIYNVHCLLLQLLCETGIIGCVAFMTPAIYIIFRMKKNVVWLRANTRKALPNLAANVALEYQLFMFLNGMIDSSWHRMSFWPFYLISIILSIAAERLGRHDPDVNLDCGDYPLAAQEVV